MVNRGRLRIAVHYEVTVFEKGPWIGGHCNTVDTVY